LASARHHDAAFAIAQRRHDLAISGVFGSDVEQIGRFDVDDAVLLALHDLRRYSADASQRRQRGNTGNYEHFDPGHASLLFLSFLRGTV
jgi:hypothetical protein